jgi:hypothetical protein
VRTGRLHILKRHSTDSNNWVMESSDNSDGEFDICGRERYEETEKKRGRNETDAVDLK